MLSKIISRIKSGGIPLLIIMASVAVFIYFKKTKPAQPSIEIAQKVWPVQALSISLGEHSAMMTLLGQVESKALVKAAAPMTAVVEQVWVQPGDRVVKGQKLVALSSEDMAIPVQSAQADVADMTSQLALEKLAYEANMKRLDYEKKVLKLKRSELSRNKKLLKKNLASQSAVDRANEAAVRQEYVVVGANLSVKEHQLKLKQLQARLLKAQANLAQAKLNQSRGVVLAPYDGRVASVSVSAGDRVSVGTPMVSFYGLESLVLKAKVPVGQEASLAKSLRNHVELHAVYQFDHQSFKLPFERLGGNSSASGVDAYFKLPADLNLMRPGDIMSVYLASAPIKQSFAVPFSALYGSNVIYLIKNNHLVKKTVQNLGQTLKNGQAWALLKGDVGQNAQVLTTHLPNAITGLSVAVSGAGL